MSPHPENKPLIIGVCGGSGSGKTSLIRRLQASFDPQDLCVVSQDDYYKPRDQQKKDEQGIENFDLPNSVDRKALRRDLERLIGGERVERLEYAFNNADAPSRTVVFLPAPVIVVEGLFVFHYKKIRGMLDLRIFVNAKENLKVIRRIMRDQRERNYPLEDVLYRYERHVLPAYERYILPHKEDADIVINNNLNFEWGLSVLQGFVADYLRRRAEAGTEIKG
ncbi:MAG: uridine kinase [Saprospiraceae bacterium]